MRKIIFFFALVLFLAIPESGAGGDYNTTVLPQVICDESGVAVSFTVADNVVDISHITDVSEGEVVTATMVIVDREIGTQSVSVTISFVRVDGSTGAIAGIANTSHCGPPPATTVPATTTTTTTTVATTTTRAPPATTTTTVATTTTTEAATTTTAASTTVPPETTTTTEAVTTTTEAAPAETTTTEASTTESVASATGDRDVPRTIALFVAIAAALALPFWFLLPWWKRRRE